MRKLILLFVLAVGFLSACNDTNASTEPFESNSSTLERALCPNIISDIEDDFRFHESEFTTENALRSLEFMKTDLQAWMENKYQRLKEFPDRDDGLIEGEIGMAYFNNIALLEGHILFLEAKAANDEEKSKKVTRFCDFLSTQVRVD